MEGLDKITDVIYIDSEDRVVRTQHKGLIAPVANSEYIFEIRDTFHGAYKEGILICKEPRYALTFANRDLVNIYYYSELYTLWQEASLQEGIKAINIYLAKSPPSCFAFSENKKLENIPDEKEHFTQGVLNIIGGYTSLPENWSGSDSKQLKISVFPIIKTLLVYLNDVMDIDDLMLMYKLSNFSINTDGDLVWLVYKPIDDNPDGKFFSLTIRENSYSGCIGGSGSRYIDVSIDISEHYIISSKQGSVIQFMINSVIK